MNNSIFFQILSSWEVIAAIVAFMLILPLTFFIASYDKYKSIEFVGLRKKKKPGDAAKKAKSGAGDAGTVHEEGQEHKTDALKHASSAGKARKSGGSAGKTTKDIKTENDSGDDTIDMNPDAGKTKDRKNQLSDSTDGYSEDE